MPISYQDTSMTVREASNNINRNIVSEHYCDATEVDPGILFEWHTSGDDYLWCDVYCNLNDVR